MKCDTCHREVEEVQRVVIASGYNKVRARAIYNCPACFAKKEQHRGPRGTGPGGGEGSPGGEPTGGA